MTNRNDRDMRMRNDRYGMNDRDDRYGMRDGDDRYGMNDRDERYGMNREDPTFGQYRDDRGSGMDRGYRGGLGDRDRGYQSDQGRHYGDRGMGMGYGDQGRRYGDQGMFGRDDQSGYGMGQSMRNDRGAFGDRSGTMYGMSDQNSGLSRMDRSTSMMGSSQPGGTMMGQHYGRGPKNYQRSDERIREDVNEQLTYHHDLDASDIDVQVQNGEVTLTGSVDDRRAKRLAEDIAEQVRGVRDVHNQLKARSGGGLLGAIGDMLSGSDDQNTSNNRTSSDRTTNTR